MAISASNRLFYSSSSQTCNSSISSSNMSSVFFISLFYSSNSAISYSNNSFSFSSSSNISRYNSSISSSGTISLALIFSPPSPDSSSFYEELYPITSLPAARASARIIVSLFALSLANLAYSAYNRFS